MDEPGEPEPGRAEPVITLAMLGIAVDPSLPPGVIALKDDAGEWWRYPLAEFTESGYCS